LDSADSVSTHYWRAGFLDVAQKRLKLLSATFQVADDRRAALYFVRQMFLGIRPPGLIVLLFAQMSQEFAKMLGVHSISGYDSPKSVSQSILKKQAWFVSNKVSL